MLRNYPHVGIDNKYAVCSIVLWQAYSILVSRQKVAIDRLQCCDKRVLGIQRTQLCAGARHSKQKHDKGARHLCGFPLA